MAESKLSKTELKHAMRDLVEEGNILVRGIGTLVQRGLGKAGMKVFTDKDKVKVLVDKIWCRPLHHYYTSRGIKDGRAALVKLIKHHMEEWRKHEKAVVSHDPYLPFELLSRPEPWHDRIALSLQLESRMKTLNVDFDKDGDFTLRAQRTSTSKDIMRDLKVIRALEKRFNPKAPRHRRIHFHEFTVLFTPKLSSGAVYANTDPKNKLFRGTPADILNTARRLDSCVSSIMAGVPVEEL